MVKKLKKEDLLRTTEDTKEVVIEGMPEHISEDGKVKFTIRPLNDKELNEVDSKMLEGVDISSSGLNQKTAQKIKQLKNKGLSNRQIAKQLNNNFDDISIDISKFIKDETEGNYKLVAYGLSCDGEEWTPEEVGQLPKGVPAELADEIREISEYTVSTIKDEENL